MPTSNIDDLLMGTRMPSAPQAPEQHYQDGPEEIEELEPDVPEVSAYEASEPESDHMSEGEELGVSEDRPDDEAQEFDEYGNEKERMPKGMKERLDRRDRKHQQEVEQRDLEIAQLRAQLANQGADKNVQNAVKDFEYDPNEAGDWQQQLASFVRQEVNTMTREQEQKKIQEEESRVQRDFEEKFQHGMSKFKDFANVINELPFQISYHMTVATRAMDDPAAFLYAAAKRNPQELERISKLRDPVAQVTEMGRLEERMRRNKPTTQAPRPLERTRENASIPAPKKKTEPSIEDLIASNDAKKINRMRARQGGRR